MKVFTVTATIGLGLYWYWQCWPIYDSSRSLFSKAKYSNTAEKSTFMAHADRNN